ncbi:DUF4440 domain-containing protein [Halobacillus salinus]|uniref:Nuclear transport factor 2 family protein n=1 Tax=Halobacillus salinus TaxID=192814 RepID=A0A4Z0H1G5_9BACI|nr:DUF4440 domain-containing protein [Halobacillus salinus]TGB03697.1 nuclear transport factor 2 family protein [Halobacillus salinus]
MVDQKELREHLYTLEATLLEADVRKSADRLDALLADDFIEYSSTGGIYDKQNILNRLPSEDDPGITLRDFEMKYLSATSALTTFKVYIESKQKHSLRSSVWTFQEDRWQMTFHQGTVTELGG